MPRCGQASRMAKAFPVSVRPSTSGTSSNIAVASRRPAIAELRAAGYQKSHRKPASAPRSGLSEGSTHLLSCATILTVSLITFNWSVLVLLAVGSPRRLPGLVTLLLHLQTTRNCLPPPAVHLPMQRSVSRAFLQPVSRPASSYSNSREPHLSQPGSACYHKNSRHAVLLLLLAGSVSLSCARVALLFQLRSKSRPRTNTFASPCSWNGRWITQRSQCQTLRLRKNSISSTRAMKR